jgi:acyl-homoserine-lactone acylase
MKNSYVRILPAGMLIPVIFLLFISGCSRSSEIIWDKWGVPHIYANDPAGMYYSFGWAQMRSHGDLILELYARSRGRASEYFGSDYLESDKKILTFGIPGLAEAALSKLDREYRRYSDAFVKGMNDFIDHNRDSIDKKLLQVYPVMTTDILAHTYRVIWLEFLGAEDIYVTARMMSPGSNALALAPSKTTSGKAMLVINPHLPWGDFFTWFEAHLNCPGFSSYGVALVGMPVLTMAFNNYLGWAHTVNPLDASDRYELKLQDDGYIFDGTVKQFTQKDYIIRVRQAEGEYSEIPFPVKYSVHGPVTESGDGRAMAIRIAGLEDFGIFEQYHRMAAAKNFTGFESALRLMQSPMFNIVYADRDGNIFYLFNGNIPVRQEGDFNFWRGNIDGSSSGLLWDKYHDYDDLPMLFNPETGFVQNCNEPPWFCTYPPVLKQVDYPPYFSSSWMTLRPQRAINLIRGHEKISFEQLIDIKLNTGMEAADRFLAELIEASSSSTDPIVLEAVRVLREWNGKTDTDSRGAVLFAAWLDLVTPDMYIRKWDPEDPADTPSGLKDPEKAAILLGKAASRVKASYGSIDVPWGEIYRFRRGNNDYPANGGPDHLGIFRTMYFEKDVDNKFRAVHGDTFHAVIEFGDNPRAMLLQAYGNSSRKGDRHNGDQIQCLSEKKLRPALFSRKDLRENTELTEKFNTYK